MDNSVGVREHLESLITHERELRMANETAASIALRLQASEYERRLQILNHSHEIMQNLQATFMTRERFDLYKDEHSIFAKQQTDSIDAHFSRVDRQLAMAAGGLAVLAILLRFVGVAI